MTERQVTPRLKSEKKKPKKSRRKALIDQCDAEFAAIVKRDGMCVGRCDGRPRGGLQCAHGFSRSYQATRWDERNAFPLCQGCHLFWTHRPIEWEDWMRDRMDPADYEDVRVRAKTWPNPTIPELVELLASLKRRRSELEEAA